MERASFIIVALLIGCQGGTAGTNTGNIVESDADGDADADTDEFVTVTVTATINFATWNSDFTEIVDNVQEGVEGVEFFAEGDDDEAEGETVATVELIEDFYVTSFFHRENNVDYLGEVKADLSDPEVEPLLTGELCPDISGAWVCKEQNDGAEYEDELSIKDDCEVDGLGNNETYLDGHRWINDDRNGVVSEDASEMTLWTGNIFQYCSRY